MQITNCLGKPLALDLYHPEPAPQLDRLSAKVKLIDKDSQELALVKQVDACDKDC